METSLHNRIGTAKAPVWARPSRKVIVHGTKLAAVMVAVVAFCSAPHAQAADFSFSFAGSSSYPGTVYGTISGLKEGVSTPTAITVSGSTRASLPYAVDFTLENATFSGTFTVANDVITAATFSLYDSANGLGIGFNVNEGTNYFGNPRGTTSAAGILNTNGFSGATFTAAPGASSVSGAPEPGVWLMMMVGVGAMGAVFRTGRRRARSALASAAC